MGQELLQRLRTLALDYGRRRPGGRAIGLNLRRLRTHLESALLREVADAALLVCGCCSTLAMGWGAANSALHVERDSQNVMFNPSSRTVAALRLLNRS